MHQHPKHVMPPVHSGLPAECRPRGQILVLAVTAALAMTACGTQRITGAPGADDASAPPESSATRPQSPAAATVARTDAQCAALVGRDLGGARVTDAAPSAAAPRMPPACVAHVAFEGSQLRFEARLPLQDWNGRMVFLGGGGFDGVFMQPNEPYFSRSVLDDHYATITTNGGYDAGPRDLGYFRAEFALDPQQLEDFTHASEHRAVAPARTIVQAFYDVAPTRSYFEGCSMGGHDALVQAQRYPQDFDGIVARAPAGNIMGLMLQFNRIARAGRVPGAAIGPAEATLLADAVRAHCGVGEGQTAGIVADPLQCDFNPETLRCAAGTTSGCLSGPQMDVVLAATTPLRTDDGRWQHPGFPFAGGENAPKGWGEYLLPNPALGGGTLQAFFSDGFLRSFVARDPKLDTSTWTPADHAARLAEVGAMFNADDPDLGALHARGGKLILANGTWDSSVSVRDTVDYYERVVQSLGPKAAGDSVELYLQPGVGHCAGGAGPDQIDLLQAVVTWVETDTKPSAQGLTLEKHGDAGEIVATAPACAYPLQPRSGSGPGDACVTGD